MLYDDGNLILDEEEIHMLKVVTMNEPKSVYPAGELIGSLNEIKIEAGKLIDEFDTRRDVDSTAPLRGEVTGLLIEICDLMINRGYEAARKMGESISFH